MKRVVLLLTLALFVIGLMIPSVSFAGSDARTADKVRNAPTEIKPPVSKEISITAECRSAKSLRIAIGTLLNRLTRSIIGVDIIDIPTDEPGGPLEIHTPPWMNDLEKTDRPDLDENPWEDTK